MISELNVCTVGIGRPWAVWEGAAVWRGKRMVSGDEESGWSATGTCVQRPGCIFWGFRGIGRSGAGAAAASLALSAISETMYSLQDPTNAVSHSMRPFTARAIKVCRTRLTFAHTWSLFWR